MNGIDGVTRAKCDTFSRMNNRLNDRGCAGPHSYICTYPGFTFGCWNFFRPQGNVFRSVCLFSGVYLPMRPPLLSSEEDPPLVLPLQRSVGFYAISECVYILRLYVQEKHSRDKRNTNANISCDGTLSPNPLRQNKRTTYKKYKYCHETNYSVFEVIPNFSKIFVSIYLCYF